MNNRKMRKHNLDIHCNAMYRWRDVGTSRTYKDFKPKNRDFEDWFDFLEAKNRKELAKMRKENVKARKQIKAKENQVRKLNKKNLDWIEWREWFNRLEDRKCSNNWRKTR